jgi:hypothetical protein
MADVPSKQQKTALFVPTLSHAQEDAETDNKIDKPGGKPMLYQRTFSSVFRAVFYTVKLHSLT